MKEPINTNLEAAWICFGETIVVNTVDNNRLELTNERSTDDKTETACFSHIRRRGYKRRLCGPETLAEEADRNDAARPRAVGWRHIIGQFDPKHKGPKFGKDNQLTMMP